MSEDERPLRKHLRTVETNRPYLWMSCGLDSFDPVQCSVEGFCEHGNEPLGPIKGEDILII